MYMEFRSLNGYLIVPPPNVLHFIDSAVGQRLKLSVYWRMREKERGSITYFFSVVTVFRHSFVKRLVGFIQVFNTGFRF